MSSNGTILDVRFLTRQKVMEKNSSMPDITKSCLEKHWHRSGKMLFWRQNSIKENIAANQPILDMLAKYSTLKNATSAQICLAWMLHKYPNVVPIPGSKNQERILENLGAWNVELTDTEFAELEQALDACTVFGTEAMWSRNRQILERTGRRNKKEQVNKRFYFEGV